MRQFLHTAQHLLKFERTREGLLMVSLGSCGVPGVRLSASSEQLPGDQRTRLTMLQTLGKHQVPHTRPPAPGTISRASLRKSCIATHYPLPTLFELPFRPVLSPDPRYNPPARQASLVERLERAQAQGWVPPELRETLQQLYLDAHALRRMGMGGSGGPPGGDGAAQQPAGAGG